jgi:hypothetical protein
MMSVTWVFGDVGSGGRGNMGDCFSREEGVRGIGFEMEVLVLCLLIERVREREEEWLCDGVCGDGKA